MMRHDVWILAAMLACSAAGASDVVPDGVEPEPPLEPTPAVPADTAAPKTTARETPRPALKPLTEDEPARVAPLAMGGDTPFTQTPSAGGAEAPMPGVPTLPTVPSVAVPGLEGEAAPAVAQGAGQDLTSDQAGAVAPERQGPFWVDLPEYPMPDGMLPPEVHESYKLVGELRKLVYKISEDLDAGGKERTRLIYNAEEISRRINKLHELWPRRAGYNDKCISAKRAALVMEEELRNEPRKWSHVRWAFQAVQKEVQALRAATVYTAEQAPRPVEVVTKDGKTVIVQPPEDTAKVLEEQRRIKREELERQRDKMREMEKKKLEDHSNPSPIIQK